MKKYLIICYVVILLLITGYGMYEIYSKDYNVNIYQDPLIKDFELKEVDNYNVFFTLSKNINYFYQLIFSDQEKAINLLSDEYISIQVKDDVDIQKSVIGEYSSISFIPKKSYSKGISNTQYYFVSGTLKCIKDGVVYYEDICIVLINDLLSKTFSLNLIDNDLETILNLYNIKDLRIPNTVDNLFKYYSFSERDVALIYINYIKDNIYFNTENIYKLFNENYSELKDFTSDLDNIFKIFDSKITSISKNSNVYNIRFTNKSIKIIENDIMDISIQL